MEENIIIYDFELVWFWNKF